MRNNIIARMLRKLESPARQAGLEQEERSLFGSSRISTPSQAEGRAASAAQLIRSRRAETAPFASNMSPGERFMATIDDWAQLAADSPARPNDMSFVEQLRQRVSAKSPGKDISLDDIVTLNNLMIAQGWRMGALDRAAMMDAKQSAVTSDPIKRERATAPDSAGSAIPLEATVTSSAVRTEPRVKDEPIHSPVHITPQDNLATNHAKDEPSRYDSPSM